jgi:hypothetical protein
VVGLDRSDQDDVVSRDKNIEDEVAQGLVGTNSEISKKR